jgi:hypothetical protein
LFQRTDQDAIREDLREFFGPRADKYLAVYDKMRAANKSYIYSLSWVGLTIYVWHFYRKIYGMGVTNIFMLLALGDLFGIYGIMAFALAFTSNTNSQYVLAAMKRVAKADALGLGGSERRNICGMQEACRWLPVR